MILPGFILWLAASVALSQEHGAPAHPHIIHIVADDLGRSDLGFRNGGKTLTPNLDQLAGEGIVLDDFYTFKICSPSRAAMLSGRYPWGIGWYDMSDEENRCLAKNYTLLPELLRKQGYHGHAFGKWDVGYILPKCTASESGFETFHGYYMACLADYWYHWMPGMPMCNKKDDGEIPHYNGTDLSHNVASDIGGWRGVNGTYDAHLFTGAAVDIIANHDPSEPLYLYLAYQNCHLGCGKYENHLGVQAPCETVQRYGKVVNDTWKVQGAMVSELDMGVGTVVEALKKHGLWNDTVFVFNSDNGGPLPHARNHPYRGGKWTFWEGGVRVEAFISGPKIPVHRRGKIYNDLIHSSDFYPTFVEGIAQGKIPSYTGPRPVDGFNVWNALMDGSASPRDEVIHQVNNSYHSGKDAQSIRKGNFKLIRDNPGDSRVLRWPEMSKTNVAFGQSGGEHEPGTDHCRAQPEPQQPGKIKCGPPNHCLFNVVDDPSEANNLSGDPKYAQILADLNRRLDEAGAKAQPPYYYFNDKTKFKAVEERICQAIHETGFLEPVH